MFNSKGDLLFVITFLTIVVARLSVVLVSGVDIVFLGFVVHHFYYGALILLLGLLIPFKGAENIKLLITGLGLGLVIDELVFIVLGGGGDTEYWSYISTIGTLLLIVTFFILRNKITRYL